MRYWKGELAVPIQRNYVTQKERKKKRKRKSNEKEIGKEMRYAHSG
jgi:hypothetical protein